MLVFILVMHYCQLPDQNILNYLINYIQINIKNVVLNFGFDTYKHYK